MNVIYEVFSYWNDPIYRNSYYLLANSVIGSGLGLLFWIISAQYYSANDVGIAVALISCAGIITTLTRLGFDFSIIRFMAEEKDKSSLINTCLTAVGFLTMIVSIIFIWGIEYWAQKLNFVKDFQVFYISFIVFTILYGLFFILQNIFIAVRDAKYTFLQNAIFGILKIPFPILLAPFLASYGIFGSWGIAISITSIITIFYFIKKKIYNYSPFLTINKAILKKILHFSFGNYIQSLLGNTPTFLIPLVILYYLAPEDNAYFYMAFTLAGILFIVPSAFATSIFAEGSFDKVRYNQNFKKTLNHTFLILAIGISILIIWGEKILSIFGYEYALNGYFLLVVLAISSIFVALNSFYYSYLRINHKIVELNIITFITSITIIFLSFFLIPHFGLNVVGFAYLTGHAIISVYIVIFFFWNKKKFPGKSFIQ